MRLDWTGLLLAKKSSDGRHARGASVRIPSRLDSPCVSLVPVGATTADRYSTVAHRSARRAVPSRPTTSGSQLTPWRRAPISCRPTGRRRSPGASASVAAKAMQPRASGTSIPSPDPRWDIGLPGKHQHHAPSTRDSHFPPMRPLHTARPVRAGKHHVAVPLALLGLLGCEAPSPVAWSAAVEVTSLEVSERFRTFGPSQTLIAGTDTIPVTLGYYCSVSGPYWDHPDYNIVSVWDGLFLRVAEDSATFADIRSRHSFPDSILIAVDTAKFRPKEYAREIESTGGYIRIPAWSPPVWNLGSISDALSRARSNTDLRSLENAENNLWRHPVADSISSSYVGRDSLRIHLVDTLSFALSGFAAAVDSVRVRCPTDQSIRDWNELRNHLDREISGLRDTMLVSLATLSLTEIGDYAAEDFAAYAYFAGMAPLRTSGDIRKVCALHRRTPLDADALNAAARPSSGLWARGVPSLNNSLDFYCQPDVLNYNLR